MSFHGQRDLVWQKVLLRLQSILNQDQRLDVSLRLLFTQGCSLLNQVVYQTSKMLNKIKTAYVPNSELGAEHTHFTFKPLHNHELYSRAECVKQYHLSFCTYRTRLLLESWRPYRNSCEFKKKKKSIQFYQWKREWQNRKSSLKWDGLLNTWKPE